MATLKIRAEALKALEDKLGRFTPDDLVAEASDPAHPLHYDGFIWDEAKAAHQCRVEHARHIISSVRYYKTTSSKLIISSPHYIRDPKAAPEQGYRNIVNVRDEREVALEALDAEIDRVVTSLDRAFEVASALELEEEFKMAIRGIDLLRNIFQPVPTGRRQKPQTGEKRISP